MKIGFFELLLLLFIALKLTDHVDWSWWTVMSPLWVPLALILSIRLILHLMIVGITEYEKYLINRRKK